MSMTLRALLDALAVDSYPAYWDALYPDAALEYAGQGCVYTSEAFLRALDAELTLFPLRRDVVYRAAAAIRKNDLLARYTVILARAIRDVPREFYTEYSSLRLPTPPDGEDPLPYEMTGFFALLSTVPAEVRALRRRGVPEDCIRATVQGFDFSITIFERRHDRPGFDTGRMNWCSNFMPPSNALTIGRFNFAPGSFHYPAVVLQNTAGAYRILMRGVRIHRSGLLLGSPNAMDEDGAYDADFIETDDGYEGYSPAPVTPGKPVVVQKTRVRLLKTGWKVVLQEGDGFLVTHIPEAQPFGHEYQLASYRRAREVYARCFPDLNIRGIHCRSWLLAPQMQSFLGPDANITRFQRDHLLYPCKCGGRDVFSHLFTRPVERLADLPERTAMERGVKAIYLRGDVLYETAGFNMTE